MASALTVLLLGCWLAGWSRVSGHAGSIPTEGTNLTQPGMAPAPTCTGSFEPGGTKPTQPGTTLAPTRPGSTGPGTSTGGRKSPSTPTEAGGSEPSAAPDLARRIMAGVSAAAAGLLLLLLAFLCSRSTGGRKAPDPRQSRESDAAATVYTLIGEGKELDVLPQEPDPGAEGLTYAEVDTQVL
ncbi:unnamed protein product [Natator depressus]